MNMKKFYDAAQAAEARVQSIAVRINEAFDAGLNEEALKLRPDLDKAKDEAKEAQQLYLSMVDASQGGSDPGQRFVPMGGEQEPQEIKNLRATAEYTREFIDAFRAGVSPSSIKAGQHRGEQYSRLLNALTETGGSPAGEQGGFLLPIDFDNMIHELQRKYVDLAQHVNVEEVTSYSGWRAVESFAASLPFAAMTENVTMDETENPEFVKVEYTLTDKGGYIPISNDLLADTPANIMNYLSKWLAKKEVLTNNSLILALINAETPVAVTDYKTTFGAIKTALNKTLDPSISASAEIFCNQSGFDILDQLVDGTGRPLLAPDITNEALYRFKGRPVVMLSDAHWANLTGPARARIAIGDGKEYSTYFRRMAMEISSTNIGGNAWRYNNTEVRAIMRVVAKEVDSAALSLLAVTLPS